MFIKEISKTKWAAVLVFFIFCYSCLSAQSYSVTGSVTDSLDNSAVTGAGVELRSTDDSTQRQGTVTDNSGAFRFESVNPGFYLLRITYIGYSPVTKAVKVSHKNITLENLRLRPATAELKAVTITESQSRVRQKEDTSEFNAKAYKTNPDATTEDLLKKMPGITSEAGNVKANGEAVQKITVDGRDFFGDDASMALKNLPADVVDRVQVFDRMSDQSRFTGFNDGNQQKAMNIVTKGGLGNSVFGRVYAGYGYLTDHTYSAGASLNWFNKDMRLTVLGQSNNINQQNFSAQDLTGIGGGGSTGPRFGGRRGGRGGMDMSPASNFTVGQQNGISTTHAAGLNYADTWGKHKKVKVTGSYFFNQSDNNNRYALQRQFFNTGDSSNLYIEENNSTTQSSNHRFNFRMEYTIDSMTSLTFTPKFNAQRSTLSTALTGANTRSGAELLSRLNSESQNDTRAYNGSAEILLQRKLKKQGRTISLNLSGTLNSKAGESGLASLNDFITDSTLLDQLGNNNSRSYSGNANLSYTEPLGKTGQLQLSYLPSYTYNFSEKNTFNADTLSGDYNLIDSALSNKFTNEYMAQKGGVSYRFADKNLNFSMGVNFQYALLTGAQEFPFQNSVRKDFYNALPTFTFNYKLEKAGNIRVYYRTSTNPPSVNQLQNVVDNSNPLLLSAGNPELKQSYNHFGMVRYGFSDPKSSHSLFVFVGVGYTHNFIATATSIANNDTLLLNNILLRAGSQLSRPENLNGQWNINQSLTYSMPLKNLKSNLNLSAGFNLNRTPGIINSIRNFANTYNISGGAALSSNISEKIDFTLSYNASYNIVKNTVQKNSDNNYFNHTAQVNFNWLFWKGFVFNTALLNTFYAGMAQGFNQNIFTWNAGVGYKFLKDRSLELRLSVNDLLNQNNGITRTVTETYVEDIRTQVLRRYILCTVTYTLRYMNLKNHRNEK